MQTTDQNLIPARLAKKLPQGGTAEEKLSALLDEKRYLHSTGTAKAAASYAASFDADADRAFRAGLLHDCAKDLTLKEARELTFLPGLEPDETEYGSRVLVHGPAGAALAAGVFGEKEPDVLAAVRYHITGRPHPTAVELAVWLADGVEPTRDYPGVEAIREIAGRDADLAVVIWMLAKLEFARDKGYELHPRTAEMFATMPERLVTLGRKRYAEIIPELAWKG